MTDSERLAEIRAKGLSARAHVEESGLTFLLRMIDERDEATAEAVVHLEARIHLAEAQVQTLRAALEALNTELHRIGLINMQEDRPRVIPELTVYMWLKDTLALLTAPIVGPVMPL